jgi:GNAT superfamily N-acetyltransferase
MLIALPAAAGTRRACFHSRMTIESARAEDVEQLLPLMRAYCEFYGVPPRDEGLEEMARALIAADDSKGMLLLARGDAGLPVAFAAVGWKWSSLRGARVAVLEDLFVHPDARRAGAAMSLIEACAERARAHGAPCLQWTTALDNHRAQSVYDRAGAEGEEWLEYELELGG